MNSGKFRHRVTIQTMAENVDEYNTPVISPDPWQTFATVWAAIEVQRAREMVISGDIIPQSLIKVTIRYLKGVNNGMRIKYGERYFDIQSVNDVEEQHRYMELTCIEGDIHGNRIR